MRSALFCDITQHRVVILFRITTLCCVISQKNADLTYMKQLWGSSLCNLRRWILFFERFVHYDTLLYCHEWSNLFQNTVNSENTQTGSLKFCHKLPPIKGPCRHRHLTCWVTGAMVLATTTLFYKCTQIVEHGFLCCGKRTWFQIVV
jgi:hypothetical protein